MSNISENLKIIKENIKQAATKSGRKPEDIKLLAVSKTIAPEIIQQAIDLGLTELGENKVQEIMSKYELLPEAKWHLIGHLQTNKVKYIVDKVEMIHSVDSLKLATEISKRASAINKPMNVLIEINIGNEESKHGVPIEEAEALAVEISRLDNINVKGLMTVAPFVENPEDNRDYFKQMYKLFIDIQSKNYNNISMEFLSMGMTNDYEVAIEEGANIIRVGTGLFGKRNYNI